MDGRDCAGLSFGVIVSVGISVGVDVTLSCLSNPVKYSFPNLQGYNTGIIGTCKRAEQVFKVSTVAGTSWGKYFFFTTS